MKAQIIKIGNSRGLRIPNAILKQCGIINKVDLRVQDHKLIITSVKSPRDGWEEALQTRAKNDQNFNNDKLSSIQQIDNSFDSEEWQW